MVVPVLIFFGCFVFFVESHAIPENPLLTTKREVSGALHIVTNDEQPIHEDVKPENPDEPAKVTPPHSGDVVLSNKSLRKSLPLSSKLELVRSVSRAAALLTLLVAVAAECYPMLRHLYYVISFFDF